MCASVPLYLSRLDPRTTALRAPIPPSCVRGSFYFQPARSLASIVTQPKPFTSCPSTPRPSSVHDPSALLRPVLPLSSRASTPIAPYRVSRSPQLRSSPRRGGLLCSRITLVSHRRRYVWSLATRKNSALLGKATT